MVKNKQSNLIASVKMLNIGVINKYAIYLGIGGGGGYSVLITNDYFIKKYRNKLTHIIEKSKLMHYNTLVAES